MELRDPARDQVLAHGPRVGLGEDVVDIASGAVAMRTEHRHGVLVARLDALQVQHRQAAEPGQLTRRPCVDDRVHRRREDGDGEIDAGELDRRVDVRWLDRLQPGRERDIVEAVGGAERIDLGGMADRRAASLVHELSLRRRGRVDSTGAVYRA